MFSKGWYRKVKTKDGFTDFKHHSSSWRNSKKLRQKSRRHKMKLDIEELKRLEVEMEEAEQMKEMLWAYNFEHEDAGDRD